MRLSSFVFCSWSSWSGHLAGARGVRQCCWGAAVVCPCSWHWRCCCPASTRRLRGTGGVAWLVPVVGSRWHLTVGCCRCSSVFVGIDAAAIFFCSRSLWSWWWGCLAGAGHPFVVTFVGAGGLICVGAAAVLHPFMVFMALVLVLACLLYSLALCWKWCCLCHWHWRSDWCWAVHSLLYSIASARGACSCLPYLLVVAVGFLLFTIGPGNGVDVVVITVVHGWRWHCKS